MREINYLMPSSTRVTEPTEIDELARAWEESPEIIRSFIEIRPQYEQLCSEVAYIVRKRMKDSGIEYSAITERAKTLKSFSEKLTRKHYDNPIQDVTDLAGVRVVYLYKSQRGLIEKIIESEFEVIEKVSKVEEVDADHFGYGALHYLVSLGRKSSGARYEDLKGLVCEIQIRTVLQDAWAIVDHHLSYKQESDVPKPLKRKLNSLSGLFETADDQFDRIREEREDYKKEVKDKRSSKVGFLDQDTNLDTFTEFLKWKFPNNPRVASNEAQLSYILSRAIQFGYGTLSALDQLLTRTSKARTAISKVKRTPYSASEVRRALALEHPQYRDTVNWNPLLLELFGKYANLVSE
ncbi:MAG: hypothetical protein WAU45_23855 [Blastocatellia bacterium]